ncbi:tRNA lysidine(34) synthetase TilS [Amorphus sp. 3PC139-8]|uniref:tRNA lysidine(34) synthetase TilS n=1 Tax=Amorphus sp. 3PC139-8 TaxID=2735676 RepID=UPI00345D7A56
MPAAPDALPVGPDARDRLFAALSRYDRIVLAVSGGADSIALMTLFGEHRAACPSAPAAMVATIDHDLRAGSAEDAAFVVEAGRELGFEVVARCWSGEKPTSDLQAAARAARYRLLEEIALEKGAGAVVTAHTRDDQAETFLLRLARGSGLKGLSAMAPVRRLGAIDLVRPLLGVGRDQLRATLAVSGTPFREDPSNANRRFARVRIRDLMPALANEGMDATRLAKTAERLARADRAIEHGMDRLAAEALAVDPGGFARLQMAPFRMAPEEIRLRLLVAALGFVGGAAYGPRLERLERVAVRLLEADQVRLTLSGARLVRAGEHIHIFREAGRGGLPDTPIAPGERIVWDGRFRLVLAETAPQMAAVRPLGPAWRKLVTPQDRGGAPAAALAGVPAFFVGEALVAVPAFGHFANREWAQSIEAGFVVAPPGEPDSTHD